MYTFEILNTDQLINKLKLFKFTRKIKELHLHHTWKPTHKSFAVALRVQGENAYNYLNSSMKTVHITQREFSDIAQHLTLFPDGMWAVGRDWNKIPASVTNHNTGTFMIECIGNFDIQGLKTTVENSLGYDKLEGKQLESLLKFSSAFINIMGLKKENIRTHNEFTDEKTCFGNGLSITEIRNKVESYKKAEIQPAKLLTIKIPPQTVNVYKEATDKSEILLHIKDGTQLMYMYKIVGEEIEGNSTWYKVRVMKENGSWTNGFVHGKFVIEK